MKEWVSLSTGQTRVDIMQSDERVTYLINGITGERFMYKEYTCTLLKNDFVPQSFLKNYKIEDNEIFKKDPNIFGIGATWMMAKKSRDQTFLKARNAPSLTRPELFNYDMYRLPLNYNPNANKGSDAIDANDIDPGYGLNLFFEPGDFEKPDSERELQIIDWVKKSFDDEPLVRVKIFFFEEQIESHHTELFDLPEGYGCERSPEFSHPLETKFSFKPIDLETPQQMTVDVALMLPYESDQTLWHTQTATVKIITGKMDGMYRYMIVESQQKQLNVQPPEIKRMKNIYDLSNEYHNILYSIDEGTGECKIEKVNDEFGTVIEFTNKISTPTATKLSAPVDVKINIENLNVLFADNDGFHLIKTLDNGVGDLQMLIHERFVEKFEAGSLRGSASIVRKTVVSSPSLVSRSNRPIQQTILTVYVYENAKPTSGGVNTKQETRKRLKAKISLRLYGHADITKQYLHKQLDISDCIDEQKKEYALMKYPLGNPDEARQLANSIDSVYFQFIKTMSLVIGMEPTQLCKIDITFDNYNMFVHMLLVDGPPKHMRYKKTKGKAFNKDSTSGLMIEEIQSSTENCAQSCEFYSCRSFSHCKNSRCTLYIRDTNADETVSDSILTDANCSVYEDDLQVVDHDVSPHKIIARIKDWLKLTEDVEENEDQNQLEADTIKSVSVQGGSSKVKTMAHYLTLHIKLFGIRLAHLTPISIESDLIDEDDLFRDRKFNSAKQLSLQDGQKEVRNQLADKLVQAQYTIEKEGSKFEVPSKDFTYSIMDHLSYQDCATYCQDTDCKSFSYCETEMECVVTKLHKARIIKSHSVKNAHCSIFLRDYLSKFERFPDTPKPDKDAKFVKVKNARECASICMESSDRDCLSFDYCSKRGQCFVYSKHGRTTMVGRTFRIVDKGHDDDPCDHYSSKFQSCKSYFCHFIDKFIHSV